MDVSSTLQESLQAAEMRSATFVEFGGRVLDESGKSSYDRHAAPVLASFPPDRGS
jgi:hypothetical protein